MLLRLIKVTGESLSPYFESGDFILATGWGLARTPNGAAVVFRHPYYGLMIKLLQDRTEDGRWFVVGSHPYSTDSREFGPIPPDWVIGRVIGAIRGPRKKKEA